LGKIDGFGDVAVGVEMVGVKDVFVRLGGGKDYNGDPSEIEVVFDFGENFAAIFAGKVQVEEDQVGARGVSEFAFLAKIGEGFNAIGDPTHVMGNARFANGFPGEASIAGVVLDEQDFYGSTRAHL
jgi:hypothetical protein